MNLKKELIRCAEVGDVVGVRRALDAGVDVHASNDSALYSASTGGYAGVVEILLSYGADVHACEDMALRYASDHGRRWSG